MPSPPATDIEKLFEYSGESVDMFLASIHKLPGIRQNLRRKINKQKISNQNAKQAAISIQRWWRKNRTNKNAVSNPNVGPNPDGVSLQKVKVRAIRTSVIEPKIKSILIPVDSPISPRLKSTSFVGR